MQQWLAVRGVTLSAILTAAALMENTAAAAAPPVLMGATVKAVLAPVAGKAATTLSPSAVALADGLIRTLAVAKVKAGVALVLAVSTVIGGASMAALQMGPPVGQANPPQEAAVMSEPETFAPPPVPLFPRIDEQVLALAFTPDGKKLVTAGARHIHPGQLKIWDVEAGKPLVTIKGISGVRSLAVSPDGGTIATGDFSGAIRLLDTATGEESTMTKGHTVGVNGVAFSADGTFLVSAGLDRTVRLWNVKDLKERKAFHGHTDMVFSVAVFRHGRSFVTGGKDNTARIWDVETGKEKFALKGHLAAVEAVAISRDDKVVATASWDQTIKLWDAETGRETAAIDAKPGAVLFVAFSPDGTLLAAGGADGTVRLWDVKTQKLTGRLAERHAGAVWAVAFCATGNSWPAAAPTGPRRSGA